VNRVGEFPGVADDAMGVDVPETTGKTIGLGDHAVADDAVGPVAVEIGRPQLRRLSNSFWSAVSADVIGLSLCESPDTSREGRQHCADAASSVRTCQHRFLFPGFRNQRA
jgi:hypothetical protein